MRKVVQMTGKILQMISDSGQAFMEKNWSVYKQEEMMKRKKNISYDGVANTTIQFAERVLDAFRKTVGRFPAETGGMIACSEDINCVDTWCFDKKSKNTSASYSYDLDDMTAVFRKWKREGKRSVGFVHSHPDNYRKPSYDDIATANELMKFFQNEFFYLPIIISNRKGMYTMYFFVVRKNENRLNVNLDYVLKATQDGYRLIPFKHWEENYVIEELEKYYINATYETSTENVTGNETKMDSNEREMMMKNNENDKTAYANLPVEEYFQRIQGVYPEHVLEKVQVFFGVGGARTIVENLARNGFRNYILIDGDRIAPPNVATQGVFISEMGMYKTEAIRKRIHDINPNANVICVNKFLDDNMTDEDFENLLKEFPNKESKDFLIYGCTDSFEANKRSSILSLKYGIPYIGAGMYQQGLAAEVIFIYPGVTASCPRCLLRSRFEANENGYINDVTSAGCPTFATERLNTLIGYIALMILMYGEAPESPYNRMLDDVKDRNFVWIRLTPYLSTSKLGINLFDRVFTEPSVSRYTFMDESLWIPQHPDSPEYGEESCKLCGGIGNLLMLKNKWKDTRKVNLEQ